MRHLVNTCALALVLASSMSAAQGQETIKIGGVAAITGPLNFSEVSFATKAVFDRLTPRVASMA